MNRERRAVVVFLILALLAAIPAVLFRPRSHESHGSASTPIVAGRDQSDDPARTAPVGSALGASTCPSVPLYPLARRTAQQRDAALIRAVNRVLDVPPVIRMERFSLGRRAWLGNGTVPDAFEFYGHRMRPIGFEGMSESVRREIGVRPTGTVDSPELLYVNRTGAALLQGRPGGEVRLTLFCGPVEL